PFVCHVCVILRSACNSDLRYIFFCYSMTPRQPPSTLFPYTTLFRSRNIPHSSRTRRSSPPGMSRSSRATGSDGGRYLTFGIGWGDRKSTRLNSSHVKSSYAVFCLKKKIINVGLRQLT